MLAAYLEKPYEIKIKEVPSPEIRNPEDVLIRVDSVGICGSDIHYYREGRIGDFMVKKPLILGHETTGVVEKSGADAEGLKEGDRVALEPGIPCRKCTYCKTGRYNLCPDVKFFATPPVDGTFCEYVVHPADFVYKLPASVSLEEGTLLEPLSVGVHACRLAKIKPGERVMVAGLGPVGLLALQTALAHGADVCGIDRVEKRLAMAEKCGAKKVFNTKETPAVKPGQSFDVVFECSGAVQLVQESINMVRRGGRIVYIGMGADTVPLNMAKVTAGEIEIKGLFRYANTYPAAIKLVEEKKIELAPLISKTFALQQAKEALEYPGENPDCIKALVKITG